jgi:hypothetical protein
LAARPADSPARGFRRKVATVKRLWSGFRLSAFVITAAIWVCIAASLVWGIASIGPGGPTATALWPFGFYILGLCVVVIRWWLATVNEPDTLGLYRLLWLRRTLGAVIVTTSVAYLLFSIADIKPHREADLEVDNLIRYGEVRTLTPPEAFRP